MSHFLQFVCILFTIINLRLSTAVYKPTLRLPDLFEYINGTKVTTASQWTSRREELKYLLDTYILGTKPETFPSISSFTKLNATQYNYGISSYYQFSVDLKNSDPIIFELICPSNVLNIKQPTFPVIMSQYNHREWLLRAVQRRLFCAVRTPTSDTRDDSQQFQALYPNQTWGTIARRAWLDSIIITCLHDHVISLEPYLDLNNIGITGHSRNGKQSLIAAAYDERITVAIGSSSGMPVSSPFRYTSRDFFGETVHTYYKFWWAPNFQQFYGKEQNCPADGHFITALIAPRYIMLANALNDDASDISFANDKNYLASIEVYKLLNFDPSNYFTVQHRQGSHHGLLRLESYLDFFSYGFGFNVTNKILNWIQHPILFHDFTFKNWNNTYNNCLNRTIPSKTEPLNVRISWLLGSDSLGNGGGYSCGSSDSDEEDYIIDMMNEDRGNWSNGNYSVNMQTFAFGGYISGNVYYPNNINNKLSLPVIIFLHPYSYACGFVPDYVNGEEQNHTDPFYFHFASRGYVVMTYHQIGFGERLFEGKDFYDRYGCSEQSRFGHMVRDVTLLIDFMECLTLNDRNNIYPKCSTGEIFTSTYSNDFNQIPNLDMSRLSLVGYAIGSSVALHAAALDKRIMNIASIAGFTPFRNNTNDLPNAGNYYFYDIHALIPKLGFFAHGKEVMIPYDYNDLFEQISPRKILIYSPTMDRNAYYNAVEECVENVKPYWINNNAANNFTVMYPDAVSDFGIPQYNAILDWLNT